MSNIPSTYLGFDVNDWLPTLLMYLMVFSETKRHGDSQKLALDPPVNKILFKITCGLNNVIPPLQRKALKLSDSRKRLFIPAPPCVSYRRFIPSILHAVRHIGSGPPPATCSLAARAKEPRNERTPNLQ